MCYFIIAHLVLKAQSTLVFDGQLFLQRSKKWTVFWSLLYSKAYKIWKYHAFNTAGDMQAPGFFLQFFCRRKTRRV
jgi:hypothetical protein